MAANDYYNTNPTQEHQNQPYYQSFNPSSQQLPQYQSHAPSLHGRPNEASPVSPFEAPFDDHVYPLGGDAHRLDSQSTLGGESRYYGGGVGGAAASQNSFRDDIPLREHPGMPAKNPMDENDHVYDAPAPHMMEEGRKKRKSGSGWLKSPKKKIAWVVYTLTAIQVGVFIGELIKNAVLTGPPIEIKPSFNPMIGPSPWVLINMGARYVPCMHNLEEIQGNKTLTEIKWGCPNATSNDVGSCTLGQLCGFGGFEVLYNGDMNQKAPNQWYRFIIPIFLHAGIIHIGFNTLLQCTLGREMELTVGPIRFFIVYISSGIFGFVLGGNFAAPGIASTGASGALFGIIGLTLLDLLYTWKERITPWKDLGFIALDVIISFVLGLLPGLDNFSHIGGFLMGIVLGICILNSPSSLQKRIDEPPYTPVKHSDGDKANAGFTGFIKSPIRFFQGRKPAWWAWWLARVLSLTAVLIIFILLLNNFYIYNKRCGWCKYLSCIDVNNWCDIGNINFSSAPSTNSTNKRSVLDSWDAMAKLAGVAA